MNALCGGHSTVHDEEGLEFKRVFISIAPDFFSEKNLCARTCSSGSTVRKTVRKVVLFTTLWTGYVKTHGKEVRINFFNLREVYLRLIILAKSISKMYKKVSVETLQEKA